MLALASLIAVPLGWVYAYAQNVVVFDDGRAGLREVHRRAWVQMLQWPGQNHALLAFVSLFDDHRIEVRVLRGGPAPLYAIFTMSQEP